MESNTRLLEFKGDLGDDLSVLLPFLEKDSSPREAAAVAAATLLDEMQSGVTSFVSAVLQIPARTMESWLNDCSPLERVAVFLSTILKSKYQFI